MMPLLHTLAPNILTWNARGSESQIDEIWIPANQINEFIIPIITSATHITDSDHKIIQIQWNTQNKITHIQRKSTHKRRIYQYKDMDKEKQDIFTARVDQILTNTETKEVNSSKTEDIAQLNKQWNKLATTIIETAKQEIPNTVKKQNFSLVKKHSYQATKLHKTLIAIRAVLRHVETNLPEINTEQCNQEIIQINKYVKEIVPEITNIESIPNTIQALIQGKKEITKARNTENKIKHIQEIKENI